MMLCSKTILLTSYTALFIGGCSVYPLPQDSTGATTEDIVANVRCQARRAVREALDNELKARGSEIVYGKYTGTELYSSLQKGEIDYKDLHLKGFIGKISIGLAYYSTTQVAYDFSLDMKEQNTQGTSIELLRQFLRRADTIGIGLTTDRTRQNTRHFRVRDSFLQLATGISHSYCKSKPGLNFVYPALGKMPIYDLVRTYININQFGTLGKLNDGGFEGTKEGPATREMADTIAFTTKLDSKNNPMIEYNPVGYGFGASGLTFTNQNSREDTHRVIVLLTTTEVRKVQSVADGRVIERTLYPDKERMRESANTALNQERLRNFENAVTNISNNGIRINPF